MDIQLIQQAAQMQRKMRRPNHPFYTQFRPYQLQPFLIAPVLPGETLTNLNLTARVITDPLLAGMGNILPWWHETYFFYVKLRDLAERSDMEAMILQGTSLSALYSAAEDETFHQGGAVNFTKLCLRRIVEEYFRNEGESWSANNLGNLPMVSAVMNGANWADSLIQDGALPTNNGLQNPDVRYDITEQTEAYERMRAMRLINMSFEEWLKTYGVTGQDTVERNKPELLRYTRNWTYPTNTVEPTTGVPSGAASWSVSERADKDRFFEEPGFIVGVQCVRAKLYMGNQRGTAVSMLEDAYTWLSALMRDRPETTVKEFVGPTSPTGPLRSQTSNYWVDIRDLFLYGDQFIAGAGTLPQPYAPAIPSAASEKRWLTGTQIDALFQSGSANKVRADGVVNLNIKGHPTTGTDNS